MYKIITVTASLTISKDFDILVKDGDKDYEELVKKQHWLPDDLLHQIGWKTDDFCVSSDEY